MLREGCGGPVFAAYRILYAHRPPGGSSQQRDLRRGSQIAASVTVIASRVLTEPSLQQLLLSHIRMIFICDKTQLQLFVFFILLCLRQRFCWRNKKETITAVVTFPLGILRFELYRLLWIIVLNFFFKQHSPLPLCLQWSNINRILLIKFKL